MGVIADILEEYSAAKEGYLKRLYIDVGMVGSPSVPANAV